MNRGDAAVTAFSGAKQLGEVPPDLHPLDLTFIDTNGATLQVFDLTQLGGGRSGQVANAPVKFQATAGEIGQVFGVTLDGDTANATPNIYVTSTSLFGLQIVSTEGDRLVKGEPGARWMPGQFGLDKGGSPGSVWKIDGATGFVSLLANIKHDGKDNAGPGLGAIAYDPATHQLFVSDLETGLIHRLGLDGGDRGTFDHGTAGRAKAGLEPVAYDAAQRMSIESPAFDIENPATWGFADKRRGVFAVAVQDERLYYSTTEGPQIWSVGLNADGSFADDAELEIDVTGTPNGNVITGIVFDGAGALYLAQRGEIVGSYDYSVFAKPEASNVLRYVWDETDQRWSEKPDEYAIGLKPPHRSTDGGIALNYGYDSDGNIDYDQCRATLWTTGEHLREGEDAERIAQGGASIIHGLQGNDKSKVRPANVPPYETWFVDNDGLFLDANVYGHVGDIASVNTRLLQKLLDDGYVPVLCSLGSDRAGNVFNINADTVAARVAMDMKAGKLILLTDAPGLLEDPDDEASLISHISASRCEEMLKTGAIRGGMVPKIGTLVEAVRGGVRRAHILDGKTAHSLLVELFTKEGTGTMVTTTEEEARYLDE